MQLHESFVQNEFAIEYIICKQLSASHTAHISSQNMSRIVKLLMDIKDISNDTHDVNVIQLQNAFSNLTTIKLQSYSIYYAILLLTNNNINYAKLIMHYVQYKCKTQNIRILSLHTLMSDILTYKTWSISTFKLTWDSQQINAVTINSKYLVDYMSAAKSINF